MKLGKKEKFAYGLGAVGKDMVYMLSASYILYYYQDIMGVSAWIMGIILLIARVFDAFNDPLMGVLVAKTKTRWGKFRPWLFIGTVTNAIVLFLMFAAPPALTGSGLVAYAAAFYILWGVTYTMMDIPFWSMVPAFTEGGKERENMSALGRTCAGVGSAIVTIVTVLAVSVLGNAAVGKSTDNETQSFDGVVTYLVELDETGAATGKVKTLRSDNGTVDSSQTALQITADRTQFTHALSFSESNCNYEIRVGDAVFNNDNSSMNFEFDPGLSDADNQVLALYVPKEVYATAAEAVSEGSADMGEREGVAVSGSITSTKEVERLGFKYFSLIVAVLFIAFILVTCTCIKEKSTVDVQTAKVGDMFKALLQNDQAMAMVITIVLVNSAVYVTSNLLIYFFKYDLGGANWQANYTLFNTFSGGIQILAMMLFFPILRRFFDTIKIFYLCIASAIGGYIILLVMALTGTNVVYPFLVPGFFIMGAVGILNVLVTIFLANTVDYGELKNHRRDESVIFSMQTFVVKLASGIAALAASVSLSVFHISDGSNAYEAAENGSLATGLQQSIDKIMKNGVSAVAGSSVIGLRFVMTVLPVAVLAVALFVFRRRYSLTDERLAEISAQLDKQRTR